MDFRQLQYMITAADCGSITKAARQLFISQSAMSHYIQTVEKEMGTVLFDRSSSPMKLTPAGELYIRSARKILMERSELEKEIGDIKQDLTGVIRIGISRERATVILPEVLPEFSQEFPNIKLDITSSGGQQLFEKLKSGEIDMMLLPDYNSLESKEAAAESGMLPGIESEVLYKEELLFAVGKDTRQAMLLEEDYIQGENLQKYNYFLLPKGRAIRAAADSVARKYGVKYNIILEMESNLTCARMAAAGMGAAILPEGAVRLLADADKLKLMHIGETGEFWNMCVWHRSGAYIRRSEEEFIAMVKRGMEV